MAGLIFILDDEMDRIAAMREVIKWDLPGHELVWFDNAPDTIAWLRKNTAEISLIGLDHDLGPNRFREGEVFDPGIGRDVADFLAGIAPICPIIIHSTNDLAVPGMKRVLEEAGWNCRSVMPYGDLDWIGEIWRDAILEVLAADE